MEQHWNLKDLGLTIVFSVIYFAVVLAATIMGGIHPLLYLFVTALIALVAWIPYYGKSAESRRGSHYEPICSNRFRGFWGACESVAWELDCLFYFSGNHSEMGRI